MYPNDSESFVYTYGIVLQKEDASHGVLRPYSSGSANLGTSSYPWNNAHIQALSVTGNITARNIYPEQSD